MSERIANHYRGDAGAKYFAYQAQDAVEKARLRVPKFLPYVRRDSIVVDFGCGPGLVLAGLPAETKIGVEANPVGREACKRNGIEVHESLDELESGIADVVISHHALEHTLSPYAELVGMHRALQPGGRLVLRLPINDWRAERRVEPDDPNHHLYTWTPLLIGNLLSEAGFESIACSVIHRGSLGRLDARLGSALPRPAFEALGTAAAYLLKRRELAVTALKPHA